MNSIRLIPIKAVVGTKFDVLRGVQQGSLLGLVRVFYKAHTLPISKEMRRRLVFVLETDYYCLVI